MLKDATDQVDWVCGIPEGITHFFCAYFLSSSSTIRAQIKWKPAENHAPTAYSVPHTIEHFRYHTLVAHTFPLNIIVIHIHPCRDSTEQIAQSMKSHSLSLSLRSKTEMHFSHIW